MRRGNRGAFSYRRATRERGRGGGREGRREGGREGGERVPWRYSPSHAVVGVGPEQVAHGAFVRNLEGGREGGREGEA
jgi:hypothetical protein